MCLSLRFRLLRRCWLFYSRGGGHCRDWRLGGLPFQQSLDSDHALLHVPHGLGQAVQLLRRLCCGVEFWFVLTFYKKQQLKKKRWSSNGEDKVQQ